MEAGARGQWVRDVPVGGHGAHGVHVYAELHKQLGRAREPDGNADRAEFHARRVEQMAEIERGSSPQDQASSSA